MVFWKKKLIADKTTLVQVMLGAIRQQAITWSNIVPDLWYHVVSSGHEELNKAVTSSWIGFKKYIPDFWCQFAMCNHFIDCGKNDSCQVLTYDFMQNIMIVNSLTPERLWLSF